jgi:hypothetical protein
VTGTTANRDSELVGVVSPTRLTTFFALSTTAGSAGPGGGGRPGNGTRDHASSALHVHAPMRLDRRMPAYRAHQTALHDADARGRAALDRVRRDGQGARRARCRHGRLGEQLDVEQLTSDVHQRRRRGQRLGARASHLDTGFELDARVTEAIRADTTRRNPGRCWRPDRARSPRGCPSAASPAFAEACCDRPGREHADGQLRRHGGCPHGTRARRAEAGQPTVSPQPQRERPPSSSSPRSHLAIGPTFIRRQSSNDHVR